MSPIAKMPGHVGLERGRLDRHQIVLQRDAPVRDRTELHGQPEERQHGVAGNFAHAVVVALDGGAGQLALVAGQRGDLAEPQIHLAGGDQRAHLLDAVGRGAKIVAPVQQRDALGDRMQIERPVERGIAAADDQHVLVAERLHLAHGVVHRAAFIGFDPRHRRPLGLERAAAGRDHQHLAFEHLAGVGGAAEQGIADLLHASRSSRRDGRSDGTA